MFMIRVLIDFGLNLVMLVEFEVVSIFILQLERSPEKYSVPSNAFQNWSFDLNPACKGTKFNLEDSELGGVVHAADDFQLENRFQLSRKD